jgi:hypothetical protein
MSEEDVTVQEPFEFGFVGMSGASRKAAVNVE